MKLSRLYNPDRYLFTSRDAQNQKSYYSNLRIPLRVPIMNIASCELIRANIPVIVPSIPDTALCFWYYRLPKQPEYAEPVPPSFEYLHCVRIQPSWVPKELVYEGDSIFDVPVNRVYDNYEDLLGDLNKATTHDVNNPFYIDGDISFVLSEESKKFGFVGNNIYDDAGNLQYF